MPSEQEWEEIEASAQAKWEEIIDRRPDDESIGFYSYGDAPAAMGGGSGCFTWFSEREEMYDFIAAVLPFNPPGPASADHLDTQKQVKAAILRHSSEATSEEELRKELNAILKSYSQIDWFGAFRDLKAATGDFPAKVVARFRDMDDEDEAEKPSPIGSEEEDDFLEYLGEYGL